MKPDRRNQQARELLRATGPPVEDQEETVILDRTSRVRAFDAFLALMFISPFIAFYALAFAHFVPRLQPTIDSIALWACWTGVPLLVLTAMLPFALRRERIWLDRDGLHHRWSDGLFRGRRTLPLAEIERVSLYCDMVPVSDESVQAEYGLEIETLGLPIRGGRCGDRDHVVHQKKDFERHLLRLNPAWSNRPPCATEVIEPASTLLEPPTGCAVRCRREWDRTEFVVGSRMSWSAWARRSLMTLVAIAIACNLLVTLVRQFDWFVLSCLIPAGTAGLALSASWLQHLRWRERWVVRPGEVKSTKAFLGFTWSRTADVEWLDRMELRRKEATSGPSSWLASWFRAGDTEPPFVLALVGLKENDVAVFEPLTSGEALWMAGIIAGVLKDAFPKDGQSFARWSVSADPAAGGSKALGDRWLDEPVFS